MDVCSNYGQNFLLTYLCHTSIAFERDAKVRQQTFKVVFEKDGSEGVFIESDLIKMEWRECAHRKWSPTACSLSACRQAIAMQQTVNTPQSALARLDKGKTSSIGKFL